jgi:hypothetical protein
MFMMKQQKSQERRASSCRSIVPRQRS